MIQEIAITNKETGESVTMSSDGNSVFVLENIDWDSPSVQLNKYRMPNQIGESFSDVVVGTRQPVIKGYVVADQGSVIKTTWESYYESQQQSINEGKRKLNKLISVFQDVVITVGNYKLYGRPMNPVKYSTDEQKNNDIMCMFQIDLECFKPLFYGGTKTVGLTRLLNSLHFPVSFLPEGIIFGEEERTNTIQTNNEGDTRTGAVFTLTAKGGIVTNPVILNIAKQEKIKCNVTMNEGDVLTINTNTKEEDVRLFKKAENKEYAVVGSIEKGSVYLQIEQGVNYFTFETEERYRKNVDLIVEYQEKFFNLEDM